MVTKFDVYARVRATRQSAGDIREAMLTVKGYNNPEVKQWSHIEDLLLDVECKLERMNLKEENNARH